MDKVASTMRSAYHKCAQFTVKTYSKIENFFVSTYHRVEKYFVNAYKAIEYKFVGWYLGDKLYDFKLPVNGDLTIEAKWEKQGEELVHKK